MATFINLYRKLLFVNIAFFNNMRIGNIPGRCHFSHSDGKGEEEGRPKMSWFQA